MEARLKRKTTTQDPLITDIDKCENTTSEPLPYREDRRVMIINESLGGNTIFPPELLDPMYELLHYIHKNGGMSSPAILFSMTSKEWTSNLNFQLTHVTNVFSRRIIKSLPPKNEAERLMKKAFQCFGCTFPIFDEANFMQRLNSDESPYEDPGWWACLNVVFALAHRLRSMVCANSEAEDRAAWGYYQNALAVLTELTLLTDSLSAVQAILGMAIIVQGTPNPAPYASLARQGMQLAQKLNLHRRQHGSGLPKPEIEERKRVFWIANIIDKEVSLRTHQMPTQCDEEMDVELPDFLYSHYPSLASKLLSDRIGLAKIQGQIYKRLLSVSASKDSYPQRILAIQDLQQKLEEWKASINIDFRREYFQDPLTAPLTHTIILRLLYFTTLDAINSAYPTSGTEIWKTGEGRGIQIHFVREARKAIKLLHVTPQGDYACIWIVLHIFVSASKTLLISIIDGRGSDRGTRGTRENRDKGTSEIRGNGTWYAQAMVDLWCIDPLLRLLGLLARGEEGTEVRGMYKDCQALFERARRVVAERSGTKSLGWVETESGENHGGGEGRKEGKESVEDFIKRMERISEGYDDHEFVDVGDREVDAVHTIDGIPDTAAWQGFVEQ